MKRILTFLPAILLFSTINLLAQQKTRQLDSIFSSLGAAGKIGGNVLIAEKGHVIYQSGFGLADEKTGRKLDSNSMFELASVSKQFTALAVAQLAEKKKLNYTDDLRSFFPELPYKGITILQLLHHTSGLPDYMELFDKYWDKTKIATNSDLITMLAKYKPEAIFAPGTKWEYSNTGYALLASVIEKASGMPYPGYLKKNIFIPAGMKNTMVYMRRYQPVNQPDYAFGFVYDKGEKKYVLPDDVPELSMVVWLDGIQGDGTVNSTTGDLLKWDRALYANKLVSPATAKLLFVPDTIDGRSTGYGFGWMVRESKEYGKVSSHSGGWPGYVTYIERHLDNDKTIIILQNHDNSLPDLTAVRRVLYGEPVKQVQKEIMVTADSLEKYVGEYELAPGYIITVTREDAALFVQLTGQKKFQVYPSAIDLFFLKVVDARILFVRDKGPVHHLVLFQNGQETEGIKIR
jgi:CubicO group peptidase (beta-lactamase class C family)